MKHEFILVGAVLALCSAFAHAQATAQGNVSGQSQTQVSAGRDGAAASNSTSGSAQGSGEHASAALGGGNEINATLSKPVDAKKAKPGDEVTATAAKDVKSGGEVVIPKGSKLIGHVTQARARGEGESASQLGIVFDKAVLKDGREVPINAAIRALAAGDAAASGSMHGAETAGSIAGNAGGSARATGGGLIGGATRTAGGAVGGVTSTTAGVSGSVGSTVGGAGSAVGKSAGAVGGLNATGQLTSGSQGVFGMKGLEIASASGADAGGSLITSTSRNVRLDGGTQMLLVTGSNTGGAEKR